MKKDRLVMTPLRKSIKTLEDILSRPKSVIVRDATVQRFEYTYEMAQKLMVRYLEQKFSSKEIDGLNRKEILRYAFENGLIKNVEAWFKYHKARNYTSHAYDEKVANRVYATAKKFLPHVKSFLVELEKRL